MSAGDSTPGGIPPLPSPPKIAPLLATLGSSHRSVAAVARSAHKVAVATGAHFAAAEMAIACVHMEAASRYAAAEHLARGMDANSCGNLRTNYIRRIAVLARRPPSLSAKASRIMGRLSDYDNLDGHEYADSVRMAQRLATRSAEDDRTTHKALRAALRPDRAAK